MRWLGTATHVANHYQLSIVRSYATPMPQEPWRTEHRATTTRLVDSVPPCCNANLKAPTPKATSRLRCLVYLHGPVVRRMMQLPLQRPQLLLPATPSYMLSLGDIAGSDPARPSGATSSELTPGAVASGSPRNALAMLQSVRQMLHQLWWACATIAASPTGRAPIFWPEVTCGHS